VLALKLLVCDTLGFVIDVSDSNDSELDDRTLVDFEFVFLGITGSELDVRAVLVLEPFV
jgi:hypothetical protein